MFFKLFLFIFYFHFYFTILYVLQERTGAYVDCLHGVRVTKKCWTSRRQEMLVKWTCWSGTSMGEDVRKIKIKIKYIYEQKLQ